MDLLVYLANHPGEVVSTDELISSVWRGRVVGDGTVYQGINELRQALGDCASNASFIETIRKRGYRLIASVEPLEPQRNYAGRAWTYGFALLGIAAFVLAALAVRYVVDGRGGASPGDSAALLPSRSDHTSFESLPTRFLAARAFYHRALGTPSRDARRSDLDRAIELDPEFAPAYARRAFMNTGRLIGVVANTTSDEASELERSILADVQRALASDPTLALAHAALAIVHQANWRGAEAEQAFHRALELSPDDVRVLWQYGEFKRFRREYDDAVRLMRRAIELDPTAVNARTELGITYRFAGDWDAAASVFQDVVNSNTSSLGEFSLSIQLAYVEASRGNVSEAVRRLRLAEQLGPWPVYRLAQIAHTYALAGRPDDAARIFADFEEQATQGGIGDGWWAYAYVAVGDYRRALERIESAVNKRINADQVALLLLAANPWRDRELDKPEFRALLDHLWLDQ